MAEFNLKIVTPDGICFDGRVKRIVVRTVSGDVGIMARHANYVSPLAVGEARITYADGKMRSGALAGGMVSVSADETTVGASTFEWSDQIDVERAKRAAEKTQERLNQHKKGDAEWKMAEYKLKRALNRINVTEK